MIDKRCPQTYTMCLRSYIYGKCNRFFSVEFGGRTVSKSFKNDDVETHFSLLITIYISVQYKPTNKTRNVQLDWIVFIRYCIAVIFLNIRWLSGPVEHFVRDFTLSFNVLQTHETQSSCFFFAKENLGMRLRIKSFSWWEKYEIAISTNYWMFKKKNCSKYRI